MATAERDLDLKDEDRWRDLDLDGRRRLDLEDEDRWRELDLDGLRRLDLDLDGHVPCCHGRE